MAKDSIHSLSVYYINGKVQKFAFRQANEDTQLTRAIDSFVESDQFIIMLENKMLDIPWNSIEHLELSHIPHTWP